MDVTHAVPPQDILHGAYVLSTCWERFPPGTVHIAVVDPGVGTSRKAVAVAYSEHYFVGPDNGVLSLALGLWEEVTDPGQADPLEVVERQVPANRLAVEIIEPRYRLPAVSTTFHGRDVFAPAAAHLAVGARLDDMGPPVRSLRTFRIGWAARTERGTEGVIVHIDRFGNAVTNIRPQDLWPGRAFALKVRSREVRGIVENYASGSRDEPIALWGSSGTLEIALSMGSAAQTLGLRRGDRVEVSRLPA